MTCQGGHASSSPNLDTFITGDTGNFRIGLHCRCSLPHDTSYSLSNNCSLRNFKQNLEEAHQHLDDARIKAYKTYPSRYCCCCAFQTKWSSKTYSIMVKTQSETSQTSLPTTLEMPGLVSNHSGEECSRNGLHSIRFRFLPNRRGQSLNDLNFQ